jgi:hypothetical protein
VIEACGGRVVGSAASPSQVTKGCQIERFAHAVFPTNFHELVAVTGGEPADVA